jgi:hypothetical protein
MVQGDEHKAMIQVLGFWLTEMLGFSADYCVTDACYCVCVWRMKVAL